MKIAFLIEDISGAGGTERVLSNLSNYLVNNNFEIEIHNLYNCRNTQFYYQIDPRISFIDHKLGHYKYKNILTEIISVKRRIMTVRNIVKTTNSDYLIGMWTDINCFLGIFSKLGTAKKIGCEHISYDFPKSMLWKYLRKKYYKNLYKTIVLTEYDKKNYKVFTNNVSVIPNALSFYPKQLCNLKSKTILSVGRLTKQKGYDSLILVVEKVFKLFPDWKLIIIGKGVERDRINREISKRRLNDKIIIKDPTPNIMEEYLNCSIFALSSRNEGFPMVLIEAMACGLPVVSFDCPTGPNEIINNGIDGFLVENQNIEEFTNALLDLIRDSKKMELFSKNARMSVQRFSSENIMKKWLNILT
jgi:glycosyltransferase involved in cell wall biosynthesis